jgi:hypothetical protein
MSGAFDPDKFLAETSGKALAFDPDAFLAGSAPAPAKAQPLDATNTLGIHFARHAALGMGDKVIAALQAASDVAHDKTGNASFGEAYKRDLGNLDRVMDVSDEAHPVARWTGNVLGAVTSGLALGAGSAAASGARLGAGVLGGELAPQAASTAARIGSGLGLGALGAYGADRSDSALGTAANTGVGAGLGLALAAAAPYAAPVMKYLGGKATDLAGYLKVNSIHPTPLLGESMAELPGSVSGVGKTLLRRSIGGMTKAKTAEQIQAAARAAGKDITALADEASGDATTEGVNLAPALSRAREQAQGLYAEPTTRAAGSRLGDVVGEYEDTYLNPVSPAEALSLKRTVADAAYGENKSYARSRDPISGKYGEGLAKLERGLDSALDEHLGPEFEARNLEYRRLASAREAAERAAARTAGNKVLGLVPHILGAAAGLGGHHAGLDIPTALETAVAATLASKYGAQAGARALYGVGRGLQMAPEMLSGAAGAVSAEAGQSMDPLRVQAIIDALRRRPAPAPSMPQFASSEPQQ